MTLSLMDLVYSRKWMFHVLHIALLVALVGCSTKKDVSNPIERRHAFPVKKIALVYSDTSAERFYDRVAYGQLMASVQQQIRLAGLSFDFLDEQDLVDCLKCGNYGAIVLPSFHYVAKSRRDAIVANLLAAQRKGTVLVVSGEFLAADEHGEIYADSTDTMSALLMVKPMSFVNGEKTQASFEEKGAKPHVDGDASWSHVYSRAWFGRYVANVWATEKPLVSANVKGEHIVVGRIVKGASAVVHFASERFMVDHNQLWKVFGRLEPFSKQLVRKRLSRASGLFVARADMDQSMYLNEVETVLKPTVDLVDSWHKLYGFKGSFYINIGNKKSENKTTDWNVSGPLYRRLLAGQNEIGSHSWTHPHHTSKLSALKLRYEFFESSKEIALRLELDSVGAAIPGNPESYRVIQTLEPWLPYLSGRSGRVGQSFPNAFGRLEPGHELYYFSLNLSPDFTLVDVLKKTSHEALAIWKEEFTAETRFAPEPVLHWLWHDYGPTTGVGNGGYSKEMFEEVVKTAFEEGYEYVTGMDLKNRLVSYDKTMIRQSDPAGEMFEIHVDGKQSGKGALELRNKNQKITWSDWLAYDSNHFWLAKQDKHRIGFRVSSGDAPQTHLKKLPKGATLFDVKGDGKSLRVHWRGKGKIVVEIRGDKERYSFDGCGDRVESDNSNELVLLTRQHEDHFCDINYKK